MRASYTFLCIFCFILTPAPAWAGKANFNGTWSIDLRSELEQKNNVDCGFATFTMVQTGDKISGDHTFFTPGCGRINEGGDGTVKGLIIGNTAVLTVTSGRNGAIVMGKATINGAVLVWQTLEEIKQGVPEGDSPLILGKGRLVRQKSQK